MKQGGGAHLTKPGWSKPHTHSNPTNLALFRHKITLYRFNQGGSYYCRGGLKWEQGAEPPSPPHFNHWMKSLSYTKSEKKISDFETLCVGIFLATSKSPLHAAAPFSRTVANDSHDSTEGCFNSLRFNGHFSTSTWVSLFY